MLQLKHAGLVRSVRGAQGGYLLARPAHSITLLDAVTAIDGPIMAALPVQDDAAETLAPFWAEVGGRIESALRATTIRAICDTISTGPMFYI
jgi:Rrf2 family cysteine metabolism transcriptional repressor